MVLIVARRRRLGAAFPHAERGLDRKRHSFRQPWAPRSRPWLSVVRRRVCQAPQRRDAGPPVERWRGDARHKA